MKLFRSLVVMLSLLALVPAAQAIPTGDGGEFFPGTLEVGGRLKFTNGVTGGSTDNFVLTVDSQGFAEWRAVPNAAGSLGGQTIDNVTLSNPTLSDDISFSNATVDGNIQFSNSVLTGIGELTTGDLTVTGALKFEDGAQDNFVLTSDADGNATWQAIPVASSDFTDASLTGTTSFLPEAGQDDAIVTGNIEFDNTAAETKSILKKAVLDAPEMTGVTRAEEIVITKDVAGTASLTVDGEVDAVSFDGDGTNIDNVTAVALTAAAAVPGSQITGQITTATLPAANVEGKVATAATADTALALDADATVLVSQLDGDIIAQGIDDGTDVNLGTTTSDILALTPSADTSIADGGSISPTSSLMRIQGDGAPVTVNSIANGSKDGQVLILRGLNSTNTVTLQAGGNLVLNSNVRFVIGNRDTISFVFDDAEDLWIET